MPLQDYLLGCRDNPDMYASVAERMLTAIGHEKLVDTSKDSRLSLIFQNRTVKYYEAFKDFYGMEDTIERIVGYFRYAAQGLEERKQILYLLGPGRGWQIIAGGTSETVGRRSTDLCFESRR
jgi:serine protein kinase